MRVTVTPALATGTVAAPPSKSMAHRLLVCAGLAGTGAHSVVRGLEPSQDVLATIDCLQALGARIAFDVASATAEVWGMDPAALAGAATLPCRECGSTLRFFVPIALLAGVPVTLTGSPRLLERPMGIYRDICADQGLTYSQDAAGINVQGPLRAGIFRFPGDVSSQFISGLLFACPTLEGESRIVLTGKVESRSYIDMTVQALADFGVEVRWDGDATLVIPGGQRYVARDGRVEGDFSNAAFFDALNCLGGAVTVEGLRDNSLQGDRVYRDCFARLAEGHATLDISNCPDLGPVLMAVGACCQGVTLTGAKRLAIKESDRGAAMAEELGKCGVQVRISPDNDTITVPGGCLTAPNAVLQGHNDHRIVMALAVVLTRVGGTVEGAQAVAKSLPDFFDRLAALGIDLKIDEEN